MLTLTLFLQVTVADWLWSMLPLKVSSSVWLRFMRPISLWRGFLFSSVGAVPGRYEAASLNGLLECNL